MHFAFLPLTATRAESPPAVPIDGAPFQGELIGATADWRLTLRANGQNRTLSAADLVRWGNCPGQGRAGGLCTADDGWIAAYIVSADGEKLTAENDLLGTFTLSLNLLEAIIFHGPPLPLGEGPGVDSPLKKSVWGNSGATAGLSSSALPGNVSRTAGQASSGTLYRTLLQNGDMLTGSLLGIGQDAVKLQTDIGAVEIPTRRVTAIILPTKPRPAVAPDAKKLRAWIGLIDGSRLLAARLTIADGSATFDALGRRWKTPAKNIVFLQPLGGRATYLSDLKPAEHQQTPYLDLTWPWRADRNATGGPLRADGRFYLKGIGVHSAARLVFSPLPLGEGPGVRAVNATRRFQALAAIDDSTDGRGSAVFRVLLDGREAYVSPTIRGGDVPVPIEVDLTGAKQLVLIVDYADRADVLDHADWLDARIVE